MAAHTKIDLYQMQSLPLDAKNIRFFERKRFRHTVLGGSSRHECR